jgi:hypothetical protein
MEESEMKRQLYRPLLIGAVTLTCCLLVAALLMTTRSAGATLRVASITLSETPVEKSPNSPSAVTRVLLPKSTAAYNGVITPATTLYAPWLLGGTSVLRVHNTGGVTATVRATFSYEGGVTTTEKLIEAGVVGEIEPSGILTGTQLSAILTGTQPIVAVVNDFGLDGTRATSYAAMPASLGRTYLALPRILSNNTGWTSTLPVQNVGVTTTSVTIVYTSTNKLETVTDTDSVHNLAPGQVYGFNPRDANLPDLFEGIATVRAAQPLVAVVYDRDLTSQDVYIFSVSLPPATDGGSRSLYFPMLANVFEDWRNSVIQLMNAGPETVSFTLEIDGSPLAETAVDPWGATDLAQNASGSQSPAGKAVAGRIANEPALHSLVWLVADIGTFAGDHLAAYSAPSVGAKIWYLPYTDRGVEFTTWVAVQNLSELSPVQITLTYHSLTGTATTIPGTTIEPLKTRLYAAELGFVGGAVVQANQPVAAIAVIAGRAILDKETYLPVITRKD